MCVQKGLTYINKNKTQKGEKMEIWMFTAPAKKGSITLIAKMYKDLDGKKYQIGLEKSRNGYRHLQGRIEISADTTVERITYEKIGKRKTKHKQKTSTWFERCSRAGIHTQKTENWCDYEGKDGYFITSEDSEDVRLQRFGTPTYTQETILHALNDTNDREIMVWVDSNGKVGKSWLTGHLWEKHKAHYIRMVGTSAESMIKDTASKMSKERRPIVIVDIPRAVQWKSELYQAIEVIKDGLIDDPRYSSNALNIKGTKVLVMTNSKPQLDKLSRDRWVIATTKVKDERETTTISKPRPARRDKSKEDPDGGFLS